MTDTTKQCTKCKEHLPLSSFHRHKGSVRSHCKACRVSENVETHKRNNPKRMWVNGKYIPMTHPLHKPGKYKTFEDAAFSSLEKYESSTEGQVYVIVNPNFSEWVKVGMAVDAADRLNGYQTSSPFRDYMLNYSWDVNDTDELAATLSALESVQSKFNAKARGGKQISMADMIVLGGAAAIESAATKRGHNLEIAFVPGRMDASQADTDVASFGALEPVADGFRNYYDADRNYMSPVGAMIDKASLLDLTVPEMTALTGGLRVLGANAGGSLHGVLTDRQGELSNDFFVNLLDMSVEWTASTEFPGVYVAADRETGDRRWTATPIDLMFGSSSELRSISEAYGADDGEAKFVSDFAAAWTKVMQSDRFDLEAVSSKGSVANR